MIRITDAFLKMEEAILSIGSAMQSISKTFDELGGFESKGSISNKEVEIISEKEYDDLQYVFCVQLNKILNQYGLKHLYPLLYNPCDKTVNGHMKVRVRFLTINRVYVCSNKDEALKFFANCLILISEHLREDGWMYD